MEDSVRRAFTVTVQVASHVDRNTLRYRPNHKLWEPPVIQISLQIIILLRIELGNMPKRGGGEEGQVAAGHTHTSFVPVRFQ